MQDFFDQIVHDVSVVSGECPDEPGNILVALQGQRGELQASNPAFGAGGKERDVFGREGETHHLGEKCGGFRGGKPHISGTQLAQVVPGA